MLQPQSCKIRINQAAAFSLRAPSILSLLSKSEYMFPLHKTHCQNLSWARPEDVVSRYSRNLMAQFTVAQLAMARFMSRTLQDNFPDTVGSISLLNVILYRFCKNRDFTDLFSNHILLRK